MFGRQLSFRISVVLLAVTAFSSCSDRAATRVAKSVFEATGPRSEWILADAAVPVDTSAGSLAFRFEESRRYGAAEGPGWLARFESVAANDSVVVVGGGIRACEVVVFHRTSGRERARFGQCGDGPGDVHHVTLLTMRADTVVLFDRDGQRVQFFDLNGRYIREARTFGRDPFPAVSGLFDGTWLNDSVAALVVRFRGHVRRGGSTVAREPDSPFVWIQKVGEATRFGAAGVEGLGVGRSNFGEEREMAACVVSKGTADGRPTLVVFNRWAAQVVVYDIDSLMSGRTAIIMNRTIRELPIGAFLLRELTPPRMTAHHMQARCGERIAVGQYLKFRNPDPTVRLASDGYLVAVAPSRLQHGVVHTEAEPFIGRLLGASGDEFYFGHQTRFDFPLIVAARLVLEPREAKRPSAPSKD